MCEKIEDQAFYRMDFKILRLSSHGTVQEAL